MHSKLINFLSVGGRQPRAEIGWSVALAWVLRARQLRAFRAVLSLPRCWPGLYGGQAQQKNTMSTLSRYSRCQCLQACCFYNLLFSPIILSIHAVRTPAVSDPSDPNFCFTATSQLLGHMLGLRRTNCFTLATLGGSTGLPTMVFFLCSFLTLWHFFGGTKWSQS